MGLLGCLGGRLTSLGRFVVASGVFSLRGCGDEDCKNSRILWRVVLLCICAMCNESRNERESCKETTGNLTPKRCGKEHTEDEEKTTKNDPKWGQNDPQKASENGPERRSAPRRSRNRFLERLGHKKGGGTASRSARAGPGRAPGRARARAS